MDHIKQLLIPITLILLFYRPILVNAATYDAPNHRVFAQDSNGSWKTLNSANGRLSIQSGNMGNSVTQVSRLPIPASNGQSYPVDVARTSAVDIAKIGGALGALARRLTPIGMAIGTAAYICQETNICDEAGQWMIPADPEYSGYPSTYPASEGRWSPGSSSGLTYPTPAAACQDSGRPFGDKSLYQFKEVQMVNASNGNCYVTRISDGATLFNSSTVRTINQCPTGYTNSGGNCIFNGTTESRTPTETDWEAAEQALNKPQSTDHVINNGGEVPIESSNPPYVHSPSTASSPPGSNSPVQQPLGTTTTTTYDANNNATGTQTKETTISITEGGTSNNYNQITINETTIINNYDLNNNLIDSTVTDTSVQPPAPPESPDVDYRIRIDDVSDVDLEEYEFPAVFSQDSWGTGSCPADRSVSYSYGVVPF